MRIFAFEVLLESPVDANSVHSWSNKKKRVNFYLNMAKPKKSRRTVSSKFKLENYQYPDKFGDWLGYKVLDVDSENWTAKVQIDIREDHLSPSRRVHGGVISSFFDFAFGAAVFSTLGPKDFCSTVELKVNYLKPIELGDVLEAHTTVVFRGKRLCVLQGHAYRKGDDSPVAMATATFNVVSPTRT